MPNETINTKSQVLILAKSIISDPANWCQGCYARNAKGVSREVNEQDACKFCASGALWKAKLDHDIDIDLYLDTVITADKRAYALHGSTGICGVVGLNDRLGHAAVMELFDYLIKVAQEQEKKNDPAN